MATIDDVLIRFTGDVTDINTKLSQLESSMGSAAASGERFGSGLKGVIDTAAGFATAQIGVQVVQGALESAYNYTIGFNAELQQSQLLFSQLFNSSSQAQDFLNTLQQFSARTPFRFDDLLKASQQLAIAGDNAKQIPAIINAIGDAVSGMPNPSMHMNEVVYSLAEMQRIGVVQQRQMRMLEMDGINAGQMMANALGVPQAKLTEMIHKGQIDSTTGLTALVNGIESSNLGGHMAAQANTFNGALTTVHDALQITLASAFRPFFTEVSAGVVGFSHFLMGTDFTRFTDQFASSFARMSQSIINGIGQYGLPVLKELWTIIQDGVSIVAELQQRLAPMEQILAMIFGGAVLGAIRIFLSLLGDLLGWIKDNQAVLDILAAVIGVVMVGAFAALTAAATRFMATQMIEFLSGLVEGIQGFIQYATGAAAATDEVDVSLQAQAVRMQENTVAARELAAALTTLTEAQIAAGAATAAATAEEGAGAATGAVEGAGAAGGGIGGALRNAVSYQGVGTAAQGMNTALIAGGVALASLSTSFSQATAEGKKLADQLDQGITTTNNYGNSLMVLHDKTNALNDLQGSINKVSTAQGIWNQFLNEASFGQLGHNYAQDKAQVDALSTSINQLSGSLDLYNTNLAQVMRNENMNQGQVEQLAQAMGVQLMTATQQQIIGLEAMHTKVQDLAAAQGIDLTNATNQVVQSLVSQANAQTTTNGAMETATMDATQLTAATKTLNDAYAGALGNYIAEGDAKTKLNDINQTLINDNKTIIDQTAAMANAQENHNAKMASLNFSLARYKALGDTGNAAATQLSIDNENYSFNKTMTSAQDQINKTKTAISQIPEQATKDLKSLMDAMVAAGDLSPKNGITFMSDQLRALATQYPALSGIFSQYASMLGGVSGTPSALGANLAPLGSGGAKAYDPYAGISDPKKAMQAVQGVGAGNDYVSTWGPNLPIGQGFTIQNMTVQASNPADLASQLQSQARAAAHSGGATFR